MKGVFIITDTFLEALGVLPKEVTGKLTKALNFLRRNSRHPSLNYEPLHRDSLFSFRLDQQYRVILRELETAPALLYVGNHDDAYRFAERTPEWHTEPAFHRLNQDLFSMQSVSADVDKLAYQLSRTHREPSISYRLSPTPASSKIVETLVRTRKYLPLAHLLLSRSPNDATVEVSFSDLERVIGNTLPKSAYRYDAWWRATDHSQASAWLSVGWKVARISRRDQKVTFERNAAKGSYGDDKSGVGAVTAS